MAQVAFKALAMIYISSQQLQDIHAIFIPILLMQKWRHREAKVRDPRSEASDSWSPWIWGPTMNYALLRMTEGTNIAHLLAPISFHLFILFLPFSKSPKDPNPV